MEARNFDELMRQMMGEQQPALRPRRYAPDYRGGRVPEAEPVRPGARLALDRRIAPQAPPREFFPLHLQRGLAGVTPTPSASIMPGAVDPAPFAPVTAQPGAGVVAERAGDMRRNLRINELPLSPVPGMTEGIRRERREGAPNVQTPGRYLARVPLSAVTDGPPPVEPSSAPPMFDPSLYTRQGLPIGMIEPASAPAALKYRRSKALRR